MTFKHKPRSASVSLIYADFLAFEQVALHTAITPSQLGAASDALYSDRSSNSPLNGPFVICTAIPLSTFLIASIDCRVSVLSSFIRQEGCTYTAVL